MSYFTRKLYAKQTGVREFSFNGMETVTGLKFHITVLCDPCQHIHFTMQEYKGRWEITRAPQPPQWILNFENELSHVINENLIQLTGSIH